MFRLKPQPFPAGLERTIDSLLTEMSSVDAESEEYSQMADQLVKLYKLKEVDASKKLSADTLALVLGNLVGIIVIVGHERVNVVTSKALQFVLKLR